MPSNITAKKQALPRRAAHFSDRQRADLRLRHLTRAVYPLGPRPIYEMFREVQAGTDLVDALERYAAIAKYASFIKEQGGERLDPHLHAVEGGRR
jgi:hypothetical protein